MRLAPDIIKLDRTLVAGVSDDPVKAALIESFVRYAREIDAAVCAEGIEDLRDLARLADLDVAYGQGYGLGRPAPPWPGPAGAAVEACRRSFAVTLAGEPAGDDLTHDHRLEQLSDRLALTSSAADLDGALELIALELHADAVRLRTPEWTLTHPARQVASGPWVEPPPLVRQSVITDPDVDAQLAEALVALGYRSRLEFPIRRRAATTGVLEAYPSKRGLGPGSRSGAAASSPTAWRASLPRWIRRTRPTPQPRCAWWRPHRPADAIAAVGLGNFLA